MSFLLNLIPAQYRLLAEIAIVALIVAAVAGWVAVDRHEHYQSGLTAGRAEVQAKWDAERAKQTADALAQAEANAKETQRRLIAQKEAQDAHDQELARYQKVAADALIQRDRLRNRADQLAAVVRRGSSDSATVAQRKDAGTAAGMLADLSGRTDSFAEIAGRYADALRRSNKQCEREYDELDVRYHKALTP